MQPSTLPRKLLVAGLLGLLALTGIPSASALAWMHATYIYEGEGGIGVWYSLDPSSGQASLKMCIVHDSYYPPAPIPADTGPDPDGGWAVWVATNPDPSSGSEKASTSCVAAPPDGPNVTLPGAVQAFL
jgi:hypothetical protein